MKIKYSAFLLLSLLISCVGEDIITDESLLVPNLSFERPLTSLAIDESFEVDLRLIIGNESVDLRSSDQFNVTFSTDKPEILTVSSTGLVTPNSESSINQKALIIVDIVENVDENPRIAQQIDEITIGAVTISESEASSFESNELEMLIAKGFDPKITISNPVQSIDANNREGIQLDAIFQNRKNEIEEIDYTWESSDTDILIVSPTGLVTPVGMGQATITVMAIFENNQVSSGNTIVVSDENVFVGEENSEPDALAFGMLQSNSSYTVTGNFEIVEENGQTVIKLDDEFSARGVPDLVLYLSNSTTSNAGAPVIAEVASFNGSDFPKFNTSGAQTLVIPNNINFEDFNNVLLYCRRFGVRVGFGTIN